MADIYVLHEPTSVQALTRSAPWNPSIFRAPPKRKVDTSNEHEGIAAISTTSVPMGSLQQALIANEVQIVSFSELEPGWNGYNARPVPINVVARAIRLLRSLNIQPSGVFPTGRESVQIEFDLEGKSLEIEILEDKYLVLEVRGGEDSLSSEEYSIDAVKDIVTSFHAADRHR